MKRRESSLYEPIVTYLKSQRARAHRNKNVPVPGRKNSVEKGWPDIEAVFPPNGLYVGVEVKRVGEDLSPEQETLSLDIQNRGGAWITAYSVQDVIGAVEKLRKEGRIA